jgi:biopolymer transport protein ExbB
MEHNPYGIAALWAQGDFLIRTIAVILLAMSVTSWYVIATRALQLVRLRRQARAAADFWHATSFGEGLHVLADGRADNPFRHLAEEAMQAVDHHRGNQADLHGHLSLSDWLTSCLRGAIDEAAERIQAGLPILASIGSTAPFIGLLGTVWGIYHALVSIGVAGQADIGRIAGPVGEALIMTAFGLFVAIPAVLGYNALVRGNKAVLGRLNRFAHSLHAYFVTGAPVRKNGDKPNLAAVNNGGSH